MFDAAEHHDLAPVVAFRLHQDRIHPHVGLDLRRQRLQVLRDTDLAAVDDAGIVGHVLRLERRNAHPPPGECAGQRGHEEALAGEAGDALDRERAHPACALGGAVRVGTTASLPSTLTT